MKKIIITLIILFLPFKVFAYGISDYNVKGTILSNGDVQMEEIFTLNGEYNGFERILKISNLSVKDFDGTLSSFYGSSIYNASDIELVSIGAYKNGKYNLFEQNNNAQSGDYGYYTVYKESDGYKYRIYNPDKYDSSFFIRYIVKNVVVVHNDYAELYYQLFSTELTESVEKYQFSLSINNNIEMLKKWAHGPLNGMVNSYDESGSISDTNKTNVTLKVNGMPSGTAVDVRVLFDKDVVKESTKYSKVDALDNVLEVEEKRANEANEQREKENAILLSNATSCVINLEKIRIKNLTRTAYEECLYDVQILAESEEKTALEKRLYVIEENLIKTEESKTKKWFAFAGLWSILSVAIILYVYNKHDKEYQKSLPTKYYRDFPAEYGPEVVKYLFNRTIDEQSLSASIANLVAKKVIKYEVIDNKKDYKLTYMPGVTELTKAENQLVVWLFEKLGENNSINLSDIKKIARKKYNSFLTQYSTWKGIVLDTVENYDFFESKFLAKLILLLTSVVGIFIIFTPTYAFSNIIAPFKMIMTLMILGIFIYSTIISRRTVKGNQDYIKWEGLKNFLCDFGNFGSRDLPHIELWEKYLVYAMVFGCAKKLNKEMKIKIAEMNYSSADNITTSAFHMESILDLSDIISSNVISAVQAATSERASANSSSSWSSSSFSSGGGSGGGFSSGGGSGGGGGGGGRF